MPRERMQIAIVGGADCDEETGRLAFEVGRHLALRGANVLCGGRGGVMDRAAAGAQTEGGLAIGILPGASAAESPPNSHLDLTVFTGMGQARNQILVLSSRAVIAIDGGWGTLSEIALALKQRIPVICLGTGLLGRIQNLPATSEPLLIEADSPAAAVDLALSAAQLSGT